MKLVIIDNEGIVHDVVEDIDQFQMTTPMARSHVADEIYRVLLQLLYSNKPAE